MNERMYNIILDTLYDSVVSADIEKKLMDLGSKPTQSYDRIPFGKGLREAALLFPKEFKAALKTFIKNGR